MRIRLRRISFVSLVLWGITAVVVTVAVVGAYLTLSQGELSPELWRDLLISGVTLGSVYALIALGYTLVYGVLFMINFAHGEVFMAGAFTGYFIGIALSDAGILNESPLPSLALVFAGAALTSLIVAVLLERIAYRRLRNAPRLVPLITAIGASLFLQYTYLGLFGGSVRAFPQVDILEGEVDILGFPIPIVNLVAIVSAIVLMVALYWYVNRTRDGRSMRAVSEDREVAAMMGINVDGVIVRTFAIGGLLAGAAAVLYTLLFTQVFWYMGILPGIKAFTAAVLGGIGNIVGAMLGGLMLGVLEQVGPNLFLLGYGIPSPNQLKDIIAFTVLVVVLIVRPNGILGRPE
jgi:branched-chain amino acid transport system permease protein